MKVVYNPGGFCGQRHCMRHEIGRTANRHRYTDAEKLAILRVLDNLMVENRMTQAQAADVLRVDTSCLTRWAQKKDELGAEPKKMHKLSEHTGPNSVLHDIELDLLNFIEEWRQKGFDVNRFTLLRKAGQLKLAILEKTVASAKICISRFLVKHNLTHRVITHKAQRDPREVEREALQFFDYIRPRMADGSRHPDYIINMDQTPVVSMCTSNNDSKRVTVAVSITALGRRIKPMVVFKGENKCND